MAIPFDTLRMAWRLEDAGVPTTQAMATITLFVEVLQARNERLNAIFLAKSEVRSEVAELPSSHQERATAIFTLEKTLLTEIEGLKCNNVFSVITMGILQAAPILGLAITFAR